MYIFLKNKMKLKFYNTILFVIKVYRYLVVSLDVTFTITSYALGYV